MNKKAYHVPTEQDMIVMAEWHQSRGFEVGENYLNGFSWGAWKEDTCVIIQDGKFTHAYAEFCRKKNYTILSVKEHIQELDKKLDEILEAGDTNKQSVEILDNGIVKPKKAFAPGMCAVGDVIVDDDYGEMMILEVGKSSFLPSCVDKFGVATGWVTYEEAAKANWKFKQNQPDTCKECGRDKE